MLLLRVAGWVKDANIRLIDASTLIEFAEGWVYGLPELRPNTETNQKCKFVSIPGAMQPAFILLIRPLVDEHILMKDSPITIHSLTVIRVEDIND